MTWIVPWKGTDWDVDPTEFTGLELSLVKQRTGLSYMQLVEGVANLDGDAVRVLFWVVERRNSPDLRFSEYDGPSLKTVIAHLPAFNEAMEEMGKALNPETGGSPGSPSSTDTPAPSTTP